jgi:hypothetical protein
MSILQLLNIMCIELSSADLNAIRKARGFNIAETASRDAFSSFFVSSIGLEEVMQSLSRDEVILLHLLNQVGEVNITFFERVYASAVPPGKPYYGTFTQQYRPTFDDAKKNLVRKGLLVMAEIKTRDDTVQMERWRFGFPSEFVPYLPPLYKAVTSDQQGVISDYAIRKNLLHFVGSARSENNNSTPFKIKEYELQLGDNPFKLKYLAEWQINIWRTSSDSYQSKVEGSLTPADALYYLLSILPDGEWAAAKDLDPILKIYCYGNKMIPAEKILEHGWEWGLFARLKTDVGYLYRLAPKSTQAELGDLAADVPWLRIIPQKDILQIDIQSMPFEQLEMLNILMDLWTQDGRLFARCNLAKLGRATPAQRLHPLSRWLAEYFPTYCKALKEVNERWGKILFHENLLIARVWDLSLRVQIERELGEKVVVLNEYFIAFPSGCRPMVEKVLKKSGFVIKTIRA